MKKLFISLFILSQLSGIYSFGQKTEKDIRTIPAGGENIIGPSSSFLRLQSSGVADLKHVTVEGFTGAIRIKTIEAATNPWELQVSSSVIKPVKKGDILLFTFYARSIEDPKSFATCVFEKNSPEWDKSLMREITITTGWDWYALPFVCDADYSEGQAKVSFQIGNAIQTIELADIVLMNYKSSKKLSDLPEKTTGTKFSKEAISVSAAAKDIPAGGVDVTGSLSGFQKLQNSGEAEVKIVSVQEQPFTKAIRINVTETPNNIWELQLSGNTISKVENNDVLLLTFYARSMSGKGTISCVFEKASPEWDKFLEEDVVAGGMWERFYIPFICKNTFSPGEAKINFRVGSKEQIIEMAEIQLINYKNQKQLASLPDKKVFEKKGTSPVPSNEPEVKKTPFERGELKEFKPADKNIPAGGFEVVSRNALFQFQNKGNAEMKETSVTGQSFSKAIQVKVSEISGNPWDIQISAKNQSAVKKGDVLLLSFSARSIASKDETGQIFGVAAFEKASPEWDKSITRDFSAGVEWQRFYVPFIAQHNFNKDDAQLNFQFGMKEQTIEVADISLVNYLDKKTIADLPQTKYTYAGRDANAPWRKEAEARIEKYRKGDISLSVHDKSGKPVKDVTVKITMQKHAYGFGTAIDAKELLRNAKYQMTFQNNFNKAVMENDLKWPQWIDTYNRETTFKALDWMAEKKIPVRGHTLVWPAWVWLPDFLKAYETDSSSLRKYINDHITEELKMTSGKLVEWDVLNEPFTNTDIQKILGDKSMAEWFKLADQFTHDSVKLYINDFGILSDGGNNKVHQDHYFNTIKFIKDNGGKIDGIGFQGHFGWQLTAPEKVWAIMDRFGELAPALQITEFDIDITDEEMQADYTRDFITAVFAHPKSTGFMAWGFWEGRHWRPNAAMYKKDWSMKANGKAWKELIYTKWWTKEEKKPNDAGIVSLRGFLGEYTYKVIDSKTGKALKSGSFNLNAKGTKLKVIL